MGGKGGGNEAAKMRQDEQERQQRIRQGTSRIDNIFGQFDDNFFADRRNAFLDFATPQLEDQYSDAQKELTFALTRGGLLDSSVRGQQAGKLQTQYDLNKQQVADQALASETDARNATEDARANLIAMLNSTGDAQGAANMAVNRASALSQPTPFSPLTNLFSSFTQGLGTQAALERANFYSGGQTGGRYNTGLFTPPVGGNSQSMTVR